MSTIPLDSKTITTALAGKNGQNLVPMQVAKMGFSIPAILSLGNLQADYYRQSGVQSFVTAREQVNSLTAKARYEDIAGRRKIRNEFGKEIVSNATRGSSSGSGSSLEAIIDSTLSNAEQLYTQRYMNDNNIQAEKFKMENALYLGESRAKLFEIGSYVKASGSLFKDLVQTGILSNKIGKIT